MYRNKFFPIFFASLCATGLFSFSMTLSCGSERPDEVVGGRGRGYSFGVVKRRAAPRMGKCQNGESTSFQTSWRISHGENARKAPLVCMSQNKTLTRQRFEKKKSSCHRKFRGAGRWASGVFMDAPAFELSSWKKKNFIKNLLISLFRKKSWNILLLNLSD